MKNDLERLQAEKDEAERVLVLSEKASRPVTEEVLSQAKRILELEREVADLKCDLERSIETNAELATRAETLMSLIALVMNIPEMTDTQLAELKANCEAVQANARQQQG